jgi:hypothetical protein
MYCMLVQHRFNQSTRHISNILGRTVAGYKLATNLETCSTWPSGPGGHKAHCSRHTLHVQLSHLATPMHAGCAAMPLQAPAISRQHLVPNHHTIRYSTYATASHARIIQRQSSSVIACQCSTHPQRTSTATCGCVQMICVHVHGQLPRHCSERATTSHGAPRSPTQ